MKEIAALTRVVEVTDNRDFVRSALPPNYKVFKVRGALFFAAGDRILGELSQRIQGLDGLILHMQYSSYLDAGGLAAIEKLMAHCEKQQVRLRFSTWQFQPLKTLAKARGKARRPLDVSFATLDEAIDDLLKLG